MKIYNIIRLPLFILLCVLISHCTKFVTVDPPITQLVTSSVFENDQTATAAMNGIYSFMQGNDGFANGGTMSIGLLGGLSADELTNYTTVMEQIEFYNNTLSGNNYILYGSLWTVPYQCIYDANGILEGLSESNTINPAIKQELTGEAKFIRAFCNFYLVNLFGDIPLILSTNYKENALAARANKDSVYSQIITDLKDAQKLLAVDYSYSMGERVRPNAWAATALLARAYLYKNDWRNAEVQADSIISQSGLYSLDADLNQVFLKNSTEAIWQLMPNIPGLNTNDGNVYILTSAPAYVAISPELMNAFEPGDMRKANWISSITIDTTIYYYPFKYKVISGDILTEYSMVLRLAEIYLIRAEARVQLNNLSDAALDINVIRRRAGLNDILVSDQPTMLNIIQHERQVELFTEWGHRWLDLIRTGHATTVLSAIKSIWTSTDTLYPIPATEIQKDPNLTQNAGY